MLPRRPWHNPPPFGPRLSLPLWLGASCVPGSYKAYEDLEAVARDLIGNLKITSPPKLACIGGSNGGLLVGNMITRASAGAALFGAAVCQVCARQPACNLPSWLGQAAGRHRQACRRQPTHTHTHRHKHSTLRTASNTRTSL